MATEDKPDPNTNDLIYEGPLSKVEYDNGCWGPNRWIVFIRPELHESWRVFAECPNEEAAMTIAKDPDRVATGDLATTEVDRIRRNQILLEQSLPKIKLKGNG